MPRCVALTHISVASLKAAPATATRYEGHYEDFGPPMIRNENEYKDAVRRLGEQEERLKQQAAQLKQTKLSKDAIKRVLDPVRSFHEQIKEEVASYEPLKRGEFDELQNFAGIGRLLIALRIAKGLIQRELGRVARLKQVLCLKDVQLGRVSRLELSASWDVPLLRSPRRSSADGGRSHEEHCFSEDSEVVAHLSVVAP